MKIEYKFADGTVSEVEVDEELGNFILESRKLEENLDKKERRHCYPLDAIDFEGKNFVCMDTPDSIHEKSLEYKKLYSGIQKLTEK